MLEYHFSFSCWFYYSTDLWGDGMILATQITTVGHSPQMLRTLCPTTHVEVCYLRWFNSKEMCIKTVLWLANEKGKVQSRTLLTCNYQEAFGNLADVKRKGIWRIRMIHVLMPTDCMYVHQQSNKIHNWNGLEQSVAWKLVKLWI